MKSRERESKVWPQSTGEIKNCSGMEVICNELWSRSVT